MQSLLKSIYSVDEDVTESRICLSHASPNRLQILEAMGLEKLPSVKTPTHTPHYHPIDYDHSAQSKACV